jgi:hypothetical protein
MAPGEADHLRDPVPGGERWIQPFHAEDPRLAPGALRRRCDSIDPLLKLTHERPGGLGHIRRVPDLLDSLQNTVEAGRFKRQDRALAPETVHSLLDDVVGHGADVAQFLGQDESRVEAFKERMVESVDAAASMEGARDVLMDLPAMTRPVIQGAARDDGEIGGLGRIVALVGHCDEPIAESKREHDLGGAW